MSALTLDSVPRVNAASLHQFVGKNVTVIGTLESSGSALTFTTTDKQVLQVGNARLPANPTRFVEILARVNNDKNITMIDVNSLGDNFDADTYNEALKLSASFPGLF